MLGDWMEREVREQPRILESASRRYLGELASYLGGRSFDMVVLAARGSSDNAALYGRYLIEVNLGIPVSLAAPSVWTRFGKKIRYRNCLAIGISQSGAAPDVSEVLAAIRADGHATLAVTNTPGSRITEAAEHTLLLGVGEERSVAATKTYTASLLAMHEIVRALGGGLDDPSRSLPTEAWTDETLEAARASLGPLLRAQTLFTLSRGYSFATAQEAALKLMECALLSCKSYSMADFQHGPRAVASHGSAAIVFGESDETLVQQGCMVVQAPRPPAPDPVVPLWDVFYGQWLALLAARARGLDPDDPRVLQKVTRTL
ncbi:MAG: SIS domain-containing protein [Fimbriimonadales bacterium]|nr:SIS domain-containing protein [Fimbriimonadales bacterium]